MEFYKIYKDTLESLNSAALSLWTGGKHTMRKPVEEMLNRERVVAEPVFQSMFPWETTDNENWKDYFRKVETIEMIREKGYSPYLHQSKAWKVLDNKIDGKNSIVVTSGTGSGKTECFMYPILDKINGNESAVQALFLYPLNALMNDQCDRLNELCERQGVRFAIYNRDTEERARENEPEVDGPKVLTRGAIRDEETTPQILLSNPSILEYILLRKKDQQFIERSRGKLKWIVIDEAHTYRGSAAVELKYQIARILEAFDMEIEDVHFVCTSATIGDDDLKLAEFISNLTGQDVNRIEVIGGRRVLPEITNGEIDICINQCGLDISVESVKTLRSEINNTEGMHLREIWTLLYGQSREYKIEEALKLIDLLCGYENKNLLKLRAHFFAKSISGIYACVNPDCPHHQDSELGFITIENSSICPHCQMPLLELVQCKHCGEFMLQGKYNETPAGKKYIKRTDRKENVDTDSEDDTSIVGRINDSVVEFIFGRNRKRQFKDIVDVAFLNENDCLSVEFLDNADYSWWQGNNDSSHCTHCGTLMGKSNAKFFRIPTRMLTKSLALPLLHATAIKDAAYGKYIAFTDSRQGTAQITKELNIESERHFYRSFFARFDGDPYTPTLDDVCDELICGNTMLDHIGANDDEYSYAKAMLRNAIGRRALYENSLESLGLLSIVYPNLNNAHIPNMLCGTPINDIEWRNFLKIALDYEIRMGNHIQAVDVNERKYIRQNANCTPIGEGNNGDNNPWVVDALRPSRLVLLLCAALGIKTREQLDENRDALQCVLNEAWAFLRNNILTRVTQNDGYNDYYIGRYYLNLSPKRGRRDIRSYSICRPEKLWYCPVTRRLIDVTFCGYSPAMTGKLENMDLYKVETDDTYNLPVIPYNLQNEQDIEEWLENNEDVRKLKNSGLWSNLHHSAYYNVNDRQYVAAEHSAQQGQSDLQQYINEFIDGRLNILNCSTTMEMGVDIGDIDFVLLTTIPPSAANYMQRAGRAGRAGQSRAAVYSICSGDNIGYKTFTEPMWAIKANIPIGKTKESRRIVQRHINSFFFRQFVISEEIKTKRLGHFFESRNANGQTKCDRFIHFLQQCDDSNTNEHKEILSRFEECFGDNIQFDATEVIESIKEIKNNYIEQINSLNDVYTRINNDRNLADQQKRERLTAISYQMYRIRKEPTLNYLAENQFIPNANMPTGLMTLECLNSEVEREKYRIKQRIDNWKEQLANADPIDEPRLKAELSKSELELDKLIKKTKKTRELRIALNEYAPGQTIVVNEKNYVSAGVVDFNLEYDTTGQYRYISRCSRCGNIRSTVAQPNTQADIDRNCPICNGIYRGIINADNTAFTTLYIPLGFRTAASSSVDRTETKSKNYYNIVTELLSNEDVNNSEINLCKISSSDNGTILYYNKGYNNGFTICGCGHVGLSTNNNNSHIPIWSTNTNAECRNGFRRVNVLLGGEFHTSFSKFVILDENNEQITDIVLLRSLGVILCRALVEYLGIDTADVDFDIQKGDNHGVLYLYDTNKGGCAYSSIFSNSDEAQKIFDMALEMLQEYSCDCEKYDDTVCTACLEERRTSEFVTQLSKKAVMQWLLKQKGILVDVPQNIKDVSIDAKSSYLKLQQVLKQTVSDKEVRDITIVGEIDDEMSTTAWSERNAIIGHLLKKAISNGKKVNIKLVVDKRYLSEYEFVYMLSKLRDRLTGMDANVNFVAPQDSDIHTALVYSKNGHCYRYFTNMIEVLEVSDNWGTDCDVLFYDSENIDFKNVDLPNLADLIVNTKTVFEADLSKVVSRIAINNLWATIKKNIGIPDNYMNVVNDILCGKNVNINFKDNYCLSALSCLILTHLIKSLKDEFHFEISTLKLSFGSKSVFNNIGDISYKWLNFKWNSEDSRNNYVKDLISEELNVKADITEQDAPHYRSLVITSDVGKVEIRPDHSIGGGWRISEKYMNVDRVSGSNVMYVEDGEDVVYYVIVEKL